MGTPGQGGFVWLNRLIEGEYMVFRVKVELNDVVDGLKIAIQRERVKSILQNTDPHTLELLKPKGSIPATPGNNLAERIWSLGYDRSKFADKLEPTNTISSLFSVDPPPNDIHIIIIETTPVTTNSAPPSWLVELHQKLRTGTDSFNRIFRTATLTENDFFELQRRLDELHPERMSESYVAKNVLATKSVFLFAKSTPLNPDVADGLIPRLVFDTSQLPSDDDADDADDADDDDDVDDDDVDDDDADDDDDDDDDAVADNAMDIDPGHSSSCHVDPHVADLSNEAKAIFPYTIRYLDLTGLGLGEDLLVPQLMLFRNEWDIMIDIFNDRTNGIRGSAVFTGQPGIGEHYYWYLIITSNQQTRKTCLLYSILILCIIRRQQIVFQDIDGNAFIIDDTVRPLMDRLAVSEDVTDILALVDADAESSVPNRDLFKVPNLRILLTSSPRKRDDRKWLTHRVQDLHAVFIMKPWSREEFVVTSLFLQNTDITLKRLQEASYICGNIPRTCFYAAVSPISLRDAKAEIMKAINDSDLSHVTSNLQRGDPIHRAFQIRPSSKDRLWNGYLVGPVSDWGFSAILESMHQRNMDEAYKFYRAIRWHTDCSQLRGKMFETYFHRFLKNHPRTFTIKSLDNRPALEIDFTFNKDNHVVFDDLARRLQLSVESETSWYLRPQSPVFPSFDSFLYQPKLSQLPQSNLSPLIALQVTPAADHTIKIKALEKVQTALKLRDPVLNRLRPGIQRNMIILFVVPDSEVTFKKQKIDGRRVDHWYKKTTQYVVTIPEEELFRPRATWFSFPFSQASNLSCISA
ncbi:hypothetical protein F5887DRAFT_1073864 [Amanita rubescens]|nr:hypothetical protein F5887DRAFT_1073864 [Amanita rubescens]